MTMPSVDFRYKTLPLVTERETKYMRTMNEVMLKPDWWIKLTNPEVVKRWKKEVEAALLALGADDADGASDLVTEAEAVSPNDSDSESNWVDVENEHLVLHVSYSQFVKQSVKFMFEELEFIASNRIHKTPSGAVVSPTSNHGVYISDSIVPNDLLSKLNSQAALIEADSLAKQKWHENSNNSVLDLVHPSDYCLAYGVTKLRENVNQICGTETAVYNGSTQGDVSTRFQWLPSEFHVAEDGKVRIQSYINNLNRRVHSDLYGTIAAAFEALVPMFEMTMGSFNTDPTPRIDAPPRNYLYQQNQYEWREEQARKAGLKEGTDEHEEFMDSLWGKERPINIPGLPESFDSSTAANVTMNTVRLGGKTLQVIVKMASIRLTPENPVYNGGNWHLEGMENEAIAATGIVYYDMSNITSSRLTFRSIYDEGDGSLFVYDQSDHAGLEKVFGFESNGNSVNTQICGQIEARAQRAVVFPNFLHHRVEEFELEDKTKPGFRRILAFFLVHPEVNVHSTRTVAMQQREWVAQDLFGLVFKRKLPFEIVEKIVRYLGSTFSAAEAGVYAHELSEERSNTPEDGYANMQNIYLCEH
ncbi:hypothetical protein CcCBS67573_g05133 [Chytriomyces confervae]|uniref:Uncharacterized protein n=1 Tax=Chytriomyces confervae TaxID=246404 RepID=A0A507FCX0_9FUNG|nr:hypothetical protein CcCBS67573_g05133 [Chytriomyces confervae]